MINNKKSFLIVMSVISVMILVVTFSVLVINNSNVDHHKTAVSTSIQTSVDGAQILNKKSKRLLNVDAPKITFMSQTKYEVIKITEDN